MRHHGEAVAVAQDETLESLSGAVNYARWLTGFARPILGEDPIEIGAGNGDYAALWLDDGISRITLHDIDAVRRGSLRARFAHEPRVQVIDDLPAHGRYSSAVCFNVIEHVEDDAAFVRHLHDLVASDGRVLILAPAFMFAFSDFDRSIGHYRRYTKARLRRLMFAAGLTDVDVRYINPLGLVAWTILMRLLRHTPRDGMLLRIWDSTVIPATRAIENRVRAPFGQSVFAQGRRA